MPKGSQPTTSAYAAQTQQVAQDQFAHLAPLHRGIVTFMKSQPPNDAGVHVSAIARAVGGDAVSIRLGIILFSWVKVNLTCPSRHVSNALDTLLDEGLVYSTIDESHFHLAL